MLDYLFDLPLIIAGPAIVVSLCLFAVVGLLFVRRQVLPHLRIQVTDGEFSGAMVQAVMVFYGLAVALIAMNVWQTYSNVSSIISQEATAIAALYRDVGGYPEPVRTQLRNQLREYTDYTINQAWPQHRHGIVPTGGVVMMNQFQDIQLAFEPVTEGQKILHAEAFRAYNNMIQARRMRLDAVGTKLPGILWFVIGMGALISLASAFFFKIEDARVHTIQVVLLAAFIGLVIFMIFALDRPFHGELGLKPDSYQLIYDHLMKP